VTHFENQLEVNEAISDDDGIVNAKRNIAIAQSMYKGGSNEEVLKANQEMYESRAAEYGEGNKFTILVGSTYAINLAKASREDEARELSLSSLYKANGGDEARELLTSLLATSKQVLGPYHCTTTKEVNIYPPPLWKNVN
jgi:hypothetical protein